MCLTGLGPEKAAVQESRRILDPYLALTLLKHWPNRKEAACGRKLGGEMAARFLTVVARIRAKAGLEEQVREALLALVAPTRAETGCLNYDLHQSQDDPGLFLFYENWRSRQDLEAHLQTPHLQQFLARAPELLAEPVEITYWDMLSEAPWLPVSPS